MCIFTENKETGSSQQCGFTGLFVLLKSPFYNNKTMRKKLFTLVLSLLAAVPILLDDVYLSYLFDRYTWKQTIATAETGSNAFVVADDGTTLGYTVSGL